MSEEYVEQILKNQQTIMNVLYRMYQPTTTQYNFNVDINNRKILLCNIEQTVNLLGRMRKEKQNGLDLLSFSWGLRPTT